MERDDHLLSVRQSLLYGFDELRQNAYKDSLSGLLNRAAMEKCIRNRMAEMSPEERCALFIIDLDDFKQVNDTLGHMAGDNAIRQTAQVLSGIFHAGDIIGRLGGDEFAVFLCGDITEEILKKKGDEVCGKLQLVLGTRSALTLTASAGIYFSDGSQPLEDMYQLADLALYKAKKSGKRKFCFRSQLKENYTGGNRENYDPVRALDLGGLLKYMDCGVVLLEMETVPRIIYASSSFFRVIGAEQSNYPIPKPLTELIHPDDYVSLNRSLIEGLKKGEIVEHIHRVAAGDEKSWLWCRIRAVRINEDAEKPLMMVTVTDVSPFKEREQQLEEVNQRLQLAFAQSAHRLWEIRLASHDFILYSNVDGKPYLACSGENFPDDLIDAGWIHPGSAERFRVFIQQLFNGQAQGYGNFVIRYKERKSYGWASISYRMVFDEIGHAVRAIGLVEDLPWSFSRSSVENTLKYSLPENLLPDLTMRMCANLTRDIIESLWVEGRDLSSRIWKVPCSQVLPAECGKVFSEDMNKRLPALFDRRQLMRMYRKGKSWMSAEYRRTDGSGNIRWIRHIVHLTEDAMTHDVYLYIYMVQTEHRHMLEQSVGSKRETEPVTGFYTPDFMRKIAEEAFRENRDTAHAVAVMQIVGLEDLQENDAVLRARHDIAIALTVALGESCLLGQYAEDKLILLFTDGVSREMIRRRIEDAVTLTRAVLMEKGGFSSLRFITGVAFQQTDYRILLEKALHVCDLWWNATSDIVVFAHEDDDWSWSQLCTGEDSDGLTVYRSELNRPLSSGEKDVAFDCITAMLSADSLGTSVQSVLQTLGTYYHADRVYILMLTENRHAVTMPYEWNSAGKSSIRQTVSGMRLERFPMLEKSLVERAPVFLSKTQPGKKGESGGPADTWCFTIFPLIQHESIDGFLCIENAREHPADAALFSTLIPYMMREKDRFNVDNHENDTIRHLLEVQDLRSYMETIATLDSARYSSLGAVCLDIPGMASINGSRGFEYGSRLLWYVANTLIDVFGASMLFRTWEAEFIAFCPNTTKQVFQKRCKRLSSILKQRYPIEVRQGSAWAEGNFSGWNLVDEARGRLHYDAKSFLFHAGNVEMDDNGFTYKGKEDLLSRITIYYQPKMDMRTGEILGAEALVRSVDRDGSVISPVSFIQFLEEHGTIRELDFFVLNRVLSQMEKWKGQGRKCIPISVNFSRITMMHPSALASVLAIQSRYPKIGTDMLELEITESVGGIEIEELRNTIDHFRACGLKISLDDFGTKYANLSLLTNVKFDTVKLDRSLIAKVADNDINQLLIKDVVQISNCCGMNCVAEGVETEEQKEALLAAGCLYAQGYYYDYPLPAEDFEEKYLRCGVDESAETRR